MLLSAEQGPALGTAVVFPCYREMTPEVDILLLQQSTGRWILRSAVLGSDREFEEARAGLEAAVSTAQQTASDGRPANVILKEWRKKARLVATYRTDAPSIAAGQVPEVVPDKT
jgi:hypothetical protein